MDKWVLPAVVDLFDCLISVTPCVSVGVLEHNNF